MQVLEEIKQALGIRDDIELAKLLGKDKSTVSKWRSSGKIPASVERELNKILFNKNALLIIPKDNQTDEFVLVPRYNVTGSCGGGALVENEEVVDYLSFRREWIKNSLRIGEKSLAVINVKGDSMEPRLRDGDVVLLDTSTKHVEDNAIYALQFNGGLSIKRVQRFMSGALEIISDNKTYKTEMIPPEQANSVRVVGRVVWAGGKV